MRSSSHSRFSAQPQRRVVICDSDIERSLIVQEQLKQINALVTVQHSVDAVELVNSTEDLLFVHEHVFRQGGIAVSTLDEAIRERIIIYFEGLNRSLSADLFSEFGANHVVANITRLNPRVLDSIVKKIHSRDIFGLEKYIQDAGYSLEMECARSEQRSDILQKVESFAFDVGLNSRFNEKLVTLVDELLTNALYNAPIDDVGHALYAHLPRSEQVILEPGKEVVIKLFAHKKRIGFSVTDRFGSLRTNRVLTHLARGLRKGTDQVNQDSGGAGLGLYYAFEWLANLVFNISPGDCTEVIGILEATNRAKHSPIHAKSMDIFIQQTP